jgi:putative transcriptional regulator
MRQRRSLPHPQVGALLLSEPFNPEPSFKRSVVLVSQHDKKGTIGFILNKPTPLSVNEALDDFPEFNAVVYWGGPLKLDSIYYIHTLEKLKGRKKITNGLFWGGDYNQLKLMIESGDVGSEEIKFVAGFAAWIPDQLEDEIQHDNWWVTEADIQSTLIEEPTVVWGNVLQGMGHIYGILNDFPEDPGLN